jgi:8-amino-7-oxononanoate synthase
MPSSLNQKLALALQSRETRNIRRRLPGPVSFTDSSIVDFSSNDYLSLSRSPTLRALFLSKLEVAPDVLGSGGSRLLINGQSHHDLEARLATFFRSPCTLLFNSGFDANVALFTCLPQPGDVIVHDEYIHASAIDGIRASRVQGNHFPFEHNSVQALRKLLSRLKSDRPSLVSGQSSVFVAVESLYSMDGTFAPLAQIVQALDEMFPKRNAYLIVDEAHATGIYGPQGRGLVARLGLEDKVLARLHTFGKALAATGGPLLFTDLSFYNRSDLVEMQL